MIDLSKRSYEKELMDDFSSEGEVINQTLRELENVNLYLGGNNISINSIQRITSKDKSQLYSIADLGCGGGYTLMHIAKWAKKHDTKVDLTGIDANTNIINFAQNNTVDFNNIDYLSEDIFSTSFQTKKFDIIHCSLFTHHFTDEELIELLKTWKKQAKKAIIINDLHRHTISYYFTKWIIGTLSNSEMVKYDSVVSIKRSFKRKELLSILNSAGIINFKLSWKWAFRWKLIIYTD